MNKIQVSMENCYGIKKMESEFDFSTNKSYVVYASNGLMKTSFAKSFKMYSIGKQPTEEVHGNPTKFSVLTSSGLDFDKDNVFVIESYDEQFGSNKVSNLLANKKLQEEYYKSINNIEKQKQEFINKVKVLIGAKANVEIELTNTYDKIPDDFLPLLEELFDSDISKSIDTGLDFKDINYLVLFDNKVEEFINDPINFKLLMDYSKQYDTLVSTSTFLEKGLFNHYNATKITEALGENGFFDAKHKLILKNGQTIESAEEFQNLLDNEKKVILSNKQLISGFKKIETALDKNAQMRNFRLIIENDLTIIPELIRFKDFKKRAWNGILKQYIEILSLLIEEYKKESANIRMIIQLAAQESDEWRKVVDIFINRFHVPFTITIGNQHDVILKDSVPIFKFSYKDAGGEIPIERAKLILILSGGEKRSLYLMNIIFEIEALKKEKKSMLVIADDIAESFDYQNKYAIIEYLKENIESGLFNFIILTHNFDFYRTVSSRIVGKDRNHCLMAVKQPPDGIELKRGEYLGNVFGYWKSKISSNDIILIACIPFIRNMIEYTVGEDDDGYKTLTSLLHLKQYDDNYNTKKITFGDLQKTVKSVWANVSDFSSTREDELIYEKIINSAITLCGRVTTEETNLENKLVLSIGIRLVAEEFMISEIIGVTGETDSIKNIKTNQTGTLLGIYKSKCDTNPIMIKILEEVVLMTSENIHLNSFMYEPLIDISILHLKELFEILIPLHTRPEISKAI